MSFHCWMFYQLNQKATHQEQANNHSISSNHPLNKSWFIPFVAHTFLYGSKDPTTTSQLVTCDFRVHLFQCPTDIWRYKLLLNQILIFFRLLKLPHLKLWHKYIYATNNEFLVISRKLISDVIWILEHPMQCSVTFWNILPSVVLQSIVLWKKLLTL